MVKLNATASTKDKTLQVSELEAINIAKQIILAPAGINTLDEARKYLPANLRLYQSNVLYPGRIFWSFGVYIVNKRRAKLGLNLDIQNCFLSSPDIVTIEAKLIDPKTNVNSDFVVSFKLKGNIVTEIRTKKENYLPLFGPGFLKPFGIFLLFKHLF